MSGMNAVALALAVFGGILLCYETGYRVGRRRMSSDRDTEGGAVEAAVFGLVGLLLGFAFSGASARLDARRLMVIHEANAIGTAYLRLDALPTADQARISKLFSGYLDARRRVYESVPDMDAANAHYGRAVQMQQEIWSAALDATAGDSVLRLLVLPAVNDMIDVSTMRSITSASHVPKPVLALLLFVALLSGLGAGFGAARRARRSWFHAALYATAVAFTIFVVTDLEYPRAGLIRVGAADEALRMLHDSIGK